MNSAEAGQAAGDAVEEEAEAELELLVGRRAGRLR
jgi:hypothetical protein